VEVREIFVSGDTPEWDAMTARTGGRTTPQLLINGEVIGGYDELAVLNAQGVLDEKLGLASSEGRETLYEVWPPPEYGLCNGRPGTECVWRDRH